MRPLSSALFLRRLPLRQCVVDFGSGVGQLLHERDLRLLLLRLGNMQVSPVATLAENRLHERSDRDQEPLAGVDDVGARIVGPAGRAAQRDLRVESAASLAGGVESLGQLPFGLSHVGAAAEQLHGHAYRELPAERELQRLTPLDVRGRDAHKGCKLIFGFVDLLF